MFAVWYCTVLYFTSLPYHSCRFAVDVSLSISSFSHVIIRSSLIIVSDVEFCTLVCSLYNGLQIVVLLVLPARVRWLSTVTQDPEDQLIWFATLLFHSSLISPSSITVLRHILDSTLDRGSSSYLSHQFSLGQWRLATHIYFRHMNSKKWKSKYLDKCYKHSIVVETITTEDPQQILDISK